MLRFLCYTFLKGDSRREVKVRYRKINCINQAIDENEKPSKIAVYTFIFAKSSFAPKLETKAFSA